MKKQTLQHNAKRFFLASLVTVSLFASAQASTGNNAGATSDKAEVKYTGTDKENLLSFHVKYANPSGTNFYLTVLDESGELLFRNVYSDKQFDKTFKLPKLNSKFTFVIEEGKNVYKEKFDVSVQTQVIENVTVNKAN